LNRWLIWSTVVSILRINRGNAVFSMLTTSSTYSQDRCPGNVMVFSGGFKPSVLDDVEVSAPVREES
jgi:hypothetical protein